MSLDVLLRTYVAADEREEADRIAMLRLLAELEWPTSHEQERAHFTASAFVINGVCSRTCLVTHAKLGRLLQPGRHVEDFDASVEVTRSRR